MDRGGSRVDCPLYAGSRLLPVHAQALSTSRGDAGAGAFWGWRGGRKMTGIWVLAALWLGLALFATLLSIWLRIATALSEIVVGTIAQLIIGALIGATVLGTGETWVKFLSGTGAIILTFLAGAELDPVVFRAKWTEAGAIGLISFAAPFIG